MSDKISAEMILKHGIFRPPVLSLPEYYPTRRQSLQGRFFPESDTGKLQKIHLSVHDGERSGFHAENEQKAQVGMAVFLKSPEPHDIQSALPEMRLRLQAEFSGRRDGLPALFVQTCQQKKGELNAGNFKSE
jgi:hypothetical protein